MVKKPLIKHSEKQLHWFWNLTTKWWFFPLAFFIMNFLYLTIFKIWFYDASWLDYIFGAFYLFFALPFGLSYFVLKFIQLIMGTNLGFLPLFIILPIAAIFYVYFAVSIFKIVKSRNKENKILKKQIKILFLLIFLSFIGLILHIYYPFTNNFSL